MGKYYLILDIKESDPEKRCDDCIFNKHPLVGFARCSMLDEDYENTSAETVKECPLIAVEDVEALDKLLNPPKKDTLCDQCESLRLYEDAPGFWYRVCENPEGKFYTWMPQNLENMGCSKGRKK